MSSPSFSATRAPNPSALLFVGLLAGCRHGRPPAPAHAASPSPPAAAPALLAAPNQLAFRSSARNWEKQGLPLGNGRLGAMVLGSTERARFQFNVDSLWTGDENPSGGYDATHFGAYQAFGNLFVELEGASGADDYVRKLDLAEAVHTSSWTGGDGTRYAIESFASHPAELIAIRISANGPRRLRGSVRLSGERSEGTRASAVAGEPASLAFSGTLPNGLVYEARALLFAERGAVSEGEDSTLAFAKCETLTILLSAATDYAPDPSAGWRGAPPGPALGRWLGTGAELGFERLREAHVADHRALFDRVDVDFGASAAEVRAEPLDGRIERYQPGRDPELAALLFQYGRYLLIASSRKNGLPANLQGLWNQSNDPPWHSDYHTNINVQMNYWAAETANLAECHEPLFRLLDAMKPACRVATQAVFGHDVPGFTYRTSHNVFGGQGWEWNTTASAWYATHYWEHYAFGRDRAFLRNQAWPYLQEVSEFWLHRLKEQSDGKLVAPDGWSPEHGPREDGVAFDQALIWELFTDTLTAASELCVSDPLLHRVSEARGRLAGPRIGRWGQLQEWIADRDDPEDRHRHTSHLVGVYPGRQITLADTPTWARAAEVSLRARGETGDSRRSWTWPWRAALFARLGKPDGHRMIDGLIQHNLLPNLITTHPPLQLDGNFGLTAAIAEMLLQSHAGEIVLLPGVDLGLWPRGSFRGLRARGGFAVSARWQDGRIASAEVVSQAGNSLEFRALRPPTRVRDGAEAPVQTFTTPSGAIRFETERGGRYSLEFD